MFKTAFKTIDGYLKIIRNGIFIVAVFITIIYLFSYFMAKDRIVMNNDLFNQKRVEMYSQVNDPKLQETELGQVQMWTFKSSFCYMIGEFCTENPNDEDNNYNTSLMGKFSTAMISPYANPPASGIIWAYEGAQNAGFIPNTYAQGVGFYALQPLAPIWKVFRNISYMVLVLITVAIGFVIMFQSSINAQAAISVQNAIPKIILSLILITFSFPIAGFLIDFMYIAMGLAGDVIIQNISDTGRRDAVIKVLGWNGDVFNQSTWNLFSRTIGNNNVFRSGAALLSLVPETLQYTFRFLVVSIAWSIYGGINPAFKDLREGNILSSVPVAGSTLKWIFASVIGRVLIGLAIGFLVPYILSLLVWISILFLFVRIFFMLFITYTKIILSIIFSPLILLLEAFPNNSTFSFWFKGLFFNLMIFPIVSVLILTSGLIANVSYLRSFNSAAFNTGTIVPVVVDGEQFQFVKEETDFWQPPYLYSVETDGFVMLIAISLLFLIPDIVQLVKKTFGVEDFPLSISPGKLLGGSGTAIAGGTGLFFKARSLASEFGVYNNTTSLERYGLGWASRFLNDDPNESLRNALASRGPAPTTAGTTTASP